MTTVSAESVGHWFRILPKNNTYGVLTSFASRKHMAISPCLIKYINNLMPKAKHRFFFFLRLWSSYGFHLSWFCWALRKTIIIFGKLFTYRGMYPYIWSMLIRIYFNNYKVSLHSRYIWIVWDEYVCIYNLILSIGVYITYRESRAMLCFCADTVRLFSYPFTSFNVKKC